MPKKKTRTDSAPYQSHTLRQTMQIALRLANTQTGSPKRLRFGLAGTEAAISSSRKTAAMPSAGAGSALLRSTRPPSCSCFYRGSQKNSSARATGERRRLALAPFNCPREGAIAYGCLRALLAPHPARASSAPPSLFSSTGRRGRAERGRMSVRLTKCDCPPIESGVAKTGCRVYVTWSNSPESEILEFGRLAPSLCLCIEFIRKPLRTFRSDTVLSFHGGSDSP